MKRVTWFGLLGWIGGTINGAMCAMPNGDNKLTLAPYAGAIIMLCGGLAVWLAIRIERDLKP